MISPLIALALPLALTAQAVDDGLVRRTDAATPGHVLFAPLRSTTTYLIDDAGDVVHEWESDAPPGQSVYLLPNGHLLRCERVDNDVFSGGGEGGRIREYDRDGEVVWEYVCSDGERRQHHDVEPLPNGNLLVIAWELVTEDEALAAGRSPQRLQAGQLWPDMVLEIAPERPSGAEVVWEWHAWDHLVQDTDPDLPHHGVIADHPHRIDVNATPRAAAPTAAELEELERLRDLGYVDDAPGDDRGGAGGRDADWLHLNSIDYSPELDVIVVSSRELSEIWFIDHSTTTEEARGSTGGRFGRGGDLLFRHGNPRWSGGDGERTLFGQHDAQWIPDGHPGAGNILVFNNGERGTRERSTVDELRIPLDPETFGDAPIEVELVASYESPDFAGHISGAQRLASGNTLICAGETGRLVEVTPQHEIVWEYVNPHAGEVRPGWAGGPGRGDRTGRGPRGEGRRPDGGGRGRRGDGGPDGGARRDGGPGGATAIFRAVHLAPDHPGLARLREE